MFRYKLTIQYDGTGFHGWQRQDGLLTIQGCIENAVQQLVDTACHVQCSGRTDAGVHAYGQVAHVDVPKMFEGWVMRNALNFFLRTYNNRIVIQHVELVDQHFHARFHSKKRCYIYKIFNHPTPSPFEQNRSWHVIKPLNVENMQLGAQFLIGTHDFTTFRDSQCQASSPVKTMDMIHITSHEPYLELQFESKSFLHHQVRNIVGTLVLVGQGKWQAQHVQKALEAKDRRAGGPTAPAQGLYFIKVDY